jgi:hypothetical protein
MHPLTVRYAASEATVFGWADPITGYVWETVYDGNPDVGTMVAVYTERQHGWAMHREPNYFAGSFTQTDRSVPLVLSHISVRGDDRYGPTFLDGRTGRMALADYYCPDCGAHEQAWT